jgi:hypothetical protein
MTCFMAPLARVVNELGVKDETDLHSFLDDSPY